MSKKTKEVVCISSTNWYPIPTRKQQVMSRLPDDYEILYVEPPITVISPLKDSSMAFKLTAFLKGAIPVKDNIKVYSPPPILPFGNIYGWLNKINQWWLSLFIKRQLQKNNMTKPLVWTYMPNSLDLVKTLPQEGLIYDCVDEHSEYQGFINKEQMLHMERQLIEACDLFFVTAQGLYETKSKYNPNTYLIPNGANFQLFNKADQEDTPVAAEIASLPSPIIGFIGVIQEWIDLKLIEKVAKDNRDGSVVLIGPVGAGIDVSSLQALPNVHLLGKKKPAELPNYIKAFDVCLNPFRQSALTKNVSPLKFYEYLATGKPIVTVDMPAIHQFADCVLIAKDDDDFLQKVKQAVAEDSRELKEKRIARGRESSWENKVAEMLALKEKMIGEVNHEKIR